MDQGKGPGIDKKCTIIFRVKNVLNQQYELQLYIMHGSTEFELTKINAINMP